MFLLYLATSAHACLMNAGVLFLRRRYWMAFWVVRSTGRTSFCALHPGGASVFTTTSAARFFGAMGSATERTQGRTKGGLRGSAGSATERTQRADLLEIELLWNGGDDGEKKKMMMVVLMVMVVMMMMTVNMMVGLMVSVTMLVIMMVRRC